MSRKILEQCLTSVNQFFSTPQPLSYNSKRDYRLGIKKIVHDLHAGGYQLSDIHHLKARHVKYLVTTWQEQGIGNATLKNRMAQLRFLARSFGKPHMIPAGNAALNIGRRSYVSHQSKAIDHIDIQQFKDPYVRYSVQLQQHFGLRREESIKFIVSLADKGDHIHLKGSWAKGGISRIIPITTFAQRALLDDIRNAVGRNKSLIPPDKTYAEQRHLYENEVKSSDYSKLHGLRHAYAQRRYHQLTQERTGGEGWQAPFKGGPSRKEMTLEMQAIDHEVRLILSRELGHSRVQIVGVYLGL